MSSYNDMAERAGFVFEDDGWLNPVTGDWFETAEEALGAGFATTEQEVALVAAA